MSEIKHKYTPRGEHVSKGPPKKTIFEGVYLYKDGTLEAEGFKDKSSDGLEFNELVNQKGFNFQKSLDNNTEIYYLPNNVRKYYSTKVSIKHEIKDAFAEYRGEVKKLVLADLDRYRKSKKALKKRIDEVQKEKHHFIFTKTPLPEDISYYPIPYSQSCTFGPYNYPTVLKTASQINNINDILVVTTGTFEFHWSKKNKNYLKTPARGKVVFISPHEEYTTSGTAYTHLGSGVISKGLEISVYKSNIIIPEGQTLKHETKYYEYGSTGNLRTNSTKVDLTPYGTEYVKPENLFTGEWDGIVPSGAYVRVETVSTDGKFLGFDGTISVIQYTGEGVLDDKIDVSCSGTFEGVGVDTKYEQSVAKAILAAKRKYYKKLNNILIEKGVKNKNSKMLRYEKMLERVANNIYDGLALTRNEKVGVAQGLASNPVGSPVYYDGFSSAYGGSRDSSNYNYVDIVLDKTSNPVSSLLFAPTGIFAGSVSISTSASSTSSTSTSAGGGGSTTY